MPRIIQLSDIHLGISGVKFDHIIDIACEKIHELNPNIIVICGDVFHNKDTFTSRDVSLFNKLMSKLSKYQIIIIPGNHDMNPHTMEDLITPLASQFSHVMYLKNTCIWSYQGVKFHHISFIDGNEINITDHKNHILLYHGTIGASHYGNVKINHEIMNKYLCTMLGDIHEYTYYEKSRACYSGSLTQLNISESYNKGFVLWDIERNVHDGTTSAVHTFIPLNIPPIFLKVDLRGVDHESIDDRLYSIHGISPNPYRVSVLLSNLDDSNKDLIIQKVISIIGRVDHYTMESNVYKPSDDIYEAITEQLDALGATDDQMILIDELHRSHVLEYSYNKWTIIDMTWSDLFQYGPNNYIDFTPSGISGVVAPNRAGKSSIIDVLVLALFGELLRGDRAHMLRITDGKSVKQSHVNVKFISNGVRYSIDRIDTKTHTKLKLISYIDGKETPITPIDVNKCYQQMRKLVGTVDQFLSTGLYYDNIYDIVRMKNCERLRILPELFGMTDNENLIKTIRAKVRSLNNELDQITSGVPTEDLPTLIKSLENIKEEISTTSNESDKLLSLINSTSESILIQRERQRLSSIISKSSIRCGEIESMLAINEPLYKKYSELKNQDIILSSKFPTVNRKLVDQLKSSIDRPKQQIIDEYESMVNRSGVTEPNGMKYNSECTECAHNKTLFRESNEEKMSKLKVLIDNYESLEVIKKISDIRKELKSLPSSDEKLSLEAELSILKNHIETANKSLGLLPSDDEYVNHHSLQEQYQLNTTKLANLISRRCTIEKSIINRKLFDEKASPIEQQLSIHKLYMKVISDPLFKVSIVNKSMNRLVSHVNDTIKFAGFTISASCDDKKINLYICDKGTKLPIESGSGFQKFICSLAIRFALTLLISSSPQFIMIDEGFGCLDDKNLLSVAELLPMISQLYKFMFVISHVPELRQSFNHTHNIDIINGVSMIGNTNKADGQTQVDRENQVPNDDSGVITCVCGSKIKRKSMASHIKSVKHLKLIAKN